MDNDREKKEKMERLEWWYELAFYFLAGAVSGLLVWVLFRSLPVDAASTEYNWDDYANGTIHGQYGWTESGAGSSNITATGCISGKCLQFTNATTIENHRATTSDIFDCFNIYPVAGNFVFSPKENDGTYSGRIEAKASGTQYWITLDDGTGGSEGIAVATGTWHEVCYINDTEGATNHCLATVNDVVVADRTCFSSSDWTHDYMSNGAGTDIILETITQWDTLPTWTKLTWYWPNEGYELANDEWSDYSLWSNLVAGDIGSYNILKITTTHEDGNSYLAWDYIYEATGTPPTGLTNWVVERPNYIPDGEVTSVAEILKTNLENCSTVTEPECIWYTVATSPVITWTASSSGYTLEDNPYLSQPGFIPASSTEESEEGAGLWTALWNRMTGIFPLSIIYQINAILTAAKNSREDAVVLRMNDLLVGDYQSVDNPPILQASLFNEGGFWNDLIYPALNTIVYGLTLFAVIYILFPKENQ